MKSVRASLLFLLTLLASVGGVSHQQSADGYQLGISTARADKVCLVVGDCPLAAQGQSTQATIQLNVSWDATGIGGSHTTYCCTTIIEPAVINDALELLHGGGGDEFDVCRQFEYCLLATLTYTITGASWDNTYGGRATYTLSSDPGRTIIEGNVWTAAGVQSTGGTGAGYNGNSLTVLSVHSGSAPYTVSVSLPALSSPGTFVACGGAGQPVCGTGTALTITPDSVIYAWVNAFHVAVALPQGNPPLGGTDAGNNPTFNATLANDNTFTADAPTTGIIAIPEIMSGTGITGPPTVNGKGTGRGYAGSYTYSGPAQAVGPVAVTANGCPIAPNTQTWNNGNTTSCRDDSTALDALSKAMQAKYSIAASQVNCQGHSEGAGMCAKLMWEHGDDFGHFGGVSMPWSLYYDAAGGGHTTLPTSQVPSKPMRSYQLIVGALDPTVCLIPALTPTCFGTANKAHVTISGTALTAQSIDGGALTAGNQITSGALPGTTLTACSDATHCTVSISQTISSSTAITTNNLFSTQIGNNSLNYTFADFSNPLSTIWPGYANVMATWANGYALHGCPAGLGSQINVADGVIANSGTSTQTMTWDYCPSTANKGYIEMVVVANGDHTMRAITNGMPGPLAGGLPPGPFFLQHALNTPVP